MEEVSVSVAPACNSTTTNTLLNNHCADDSISAASASDVQDRLSSLELRVQQQEDEITVMKAALADVLRRLALSEDTATTAKKQTSTKGQTPLREAYSMSCIANGSSSSRKPSHRDRDSSTVSVTRKDTFSSAAKSGQTAERKKDKPQMEGIKEKEEGPSQPNQANDKPSPASPVQPSPSPSISSHPPSPHPPQSQRQAPESKGTSPAKRFLRCPLWSSVSRPAPTLPTQCPPTL